MLECLVLLLGVRWMCKEMWFFLGIKIYSLSLSFCLFPPSLLPSYPPKLPNFCNGRFKRFNPQTGQLSWTRWCFTRRRFDFNGFVALGDSERCWPLHPSPVFARLLRMWTDAWWPVFHLGCLFRVDIPPSPLIHSHPHPRSIQVVTHTGDPKSRNLNQQFVVVGLNLHLVTRGLSGDTSGVWVTHDSGSAWPQGH